MKTVLFAIFIPFMILTRVLLGSLDDQRIRKYINSQGGEIISISHKPFGKGWFGEESNRIYSIQYKDMSSNTREAFVKTSLWGGVYLTEDTIIQLASQDAVYQPGIHPEISSQVGYVELLQWENELLKKQLRKMREELET